MKLLLIGTTAMLVACQSMPTVNRGSFDSFDRSLNTKSYGYQVLTDKTTGAPTSMIERFEVRPGDCSSNSGWSDCANDRERSELSQKGGRNLVESTYWYGWSMFVPVDYKNIYPTKVALGQFHQDGSHPVWMFQNGMAGLSLDDQVYGSTRKYYPLIQESDLRGKWHQIEVHARWTKGETGFMNVWINGEQKVAYSGQTMTASKVYFKYGVYRSFMSRYRNLNGVKDVPAQVVFYSNVRRADTREELHPPKSQD